MWLKGERSFWLSRHLFFVGRRKLSHFQVWNQIKGQLLSEFAKHSPCQNGLRAFFSKSSNLKIANYQRQTSRPFTKVKLTWSLEAAQVAEDIGMNLVVAGIWLCFCLLNLSYMILLKSWYYQCWFLYKYDFYLIVRKLTIVRCQKLGRYLKENKNLGSMIKRVNLF